MAETLDFSSQERIVDRIKALREKYPNYEDVYMYHVAIGSTPLEGMRFEKFDFEGEDSLVDFLTRELTPESLEKAAKAA